MNDEEAEGSLGPLSGLSAGGQLHVMRLLGYVMMDPRRHALQRDTGALLCGTQGRLNDAPLRSPCRLGFQRGTSCRGSEVVGATSASGETRGAPRLSQCRVETTPVTASVKADRVVHDDIHACPLIPEVVPDAVFL